MLIQSRIDLPVRAELAHPCAAAQPCVLLPALWACAVQPHASPLLSAEKIPSYVTGDLPTMRLACLGRGIRSPLLHEAAVRVSTPKSFAARSSPTCSINCFRFIVRQELYTVCVNSASGFLHIKLSAVLGGYR